MLVSGHATLTATRPTKARDFEGPGGPEIKQAIYEEANPGNDDVKSNVRQEMRLLDLRDR